MSGSVIEPDGRECVVSDLVDFALRGSGGIERWRAARTIRAWLNLRGPTFDGVGQPTVLDGIRVAVDVHRQRTVFTDYTGPGRIGTWTPDRVTVADRSGTVLSGRHGPREQFPPRDEHTRWDELHALYFAGYAMWNYLTTPFLLTWPGVQVEELDPERQDDGETWRRAKVTFPPEIAAHSAEQEWYHDEAGRLRRMEYAPYVLGGFRGSHRVGGHREVGGLVFPTHRCVLPVRDGRTGADPIILVDFADLSVEVDR
jgi:hypothetical protein